MPHRVVQNKGNNKLLLCAIQHSKQALNQRESPHPALPGWDWGRGDLTPPPFLSMGSVAAPLQ